MSYDLDSLSAKYGGMQIFSVVFATVSDVAGTTVIPGVAGQVAVVHQVTLTASTWCKAVLERATGAASSYWNGFAGQAQFFEGTRFVTDTGASVFAELASVAALTGNGLLRGYFTYQKGGAGTSP